MINSKTDLTATSHLKAHLKPFSRSHSSGYSITHSTGASLIEVLVALIVLSIGVLGIVGLQLIATKANQTNQSFIQASLIANNLANRVSVNKVSIFNDLSVGINTPYFSPNSYDFSSFSSCDNSNYVCFCQQVPSVIQTCRSNSQSSLNFCNSTQLVQFDTYEVSCILAKLSNDAKVIIDSNMDGIAGIDGNEILLLDINILWPNQTKNKPSYPSQSSCELATQGFNQVYQCYSQQLVLVDSRDES
jgi:type IV pilus modification protein PilV